jgi:hypothetical protein
MSKLDVSVESQSPFSNVARAPNVSEAHYQIQFIASERVIEKLAYITDILSEEGDEPSVAEVLEVSLDSLIGMLSGA